MKPLSLDEVREFVNANIVTFHEKKLKSLENLSLETLLKKKNPYLFRAKNVTVASELIEEILDAFLSSSEEKLFGDFLEDLAVFVNMRTCDGHKSSALGVDLEFKNSEIHYIVSIKSGPNWGNSSQQRRQEDDFKDAVKRLKQSQHTLNVQAVLGICYGKTRTSYLRGYLKVVGQNFWYFISGNKDLYTDIIEPIGYRAKEHNEIFLQGKGRLVNLFTQQFLDEYTDYGNINWAQLVALNSGNLDLE